MICLKMLGPQNKLKNQILPNSIKLNQFFKININLMFEYGEMMNLFKNTSLKKNILFCTGKMVLLCFILIELNKFKKNI